MQDVKAQGIRILDVVFIGPLMIWGGVHAAKTHKAPGAVLGLLGVATILYNASNYAKVEKERAP